MGSIRKRADGSVHIHDVQFNAFDPQVTQVAVDLFGQFFARATERRDVSIRLARDYDEIRWIGGARKVPGPWSVEFIPFDGHMLTVEDGPNTYVVG